MTRTSTSFLNALAEQDNPAAWRRFYAGYTPMLLAYAKRVGMADADAQDAVAETLATFVQKFRAGGYDRSRARLKSWLGGIMVNKIRHVLRGRLPTGSGQPDIDAAPDSAVTDEMMHAAFEHEWQLERLNQALALLRNEVDPTTYQAFDLYALKDWPVAKVATFLDVTPNVVYISKTRVVRRLRELVAAASDEE